MKLSSQSSIFSVALSISMASAGVAIASEKTACSEASGVIAVVVERMPDFQASGIKPRMAVTRIGGAAGVALAYAEDDDWSDAETAPLVALRDTREPNENGQTISKEEAPGVIYGHAEELVEELRRKCPNVEIADLTSVAPGG